MLKTIFSRIIQTIVVVFCLVTLTFFLVEALPGNPFVADGGKALDSHEMKQLEKTFNLDKPTPVRYLTYWKNILLSGDFGLSTSLQGRSVSEIIAQSFPISFVLGLIALILSILIGIPLGIIAALKKNGIIDYIAMFTAMIGICIPAFVMGPLLQNFIALKLDSINVAGWAEFSDIILPALTLSLGGAAYLARLTRGGMLDVLSQDFIRTAKAKGVSDLNIILKHCLRPALLPAVTFLGPAFAGIITGSFIVETIFQVPGRHPHGTRQPRRRHCPRHHEPKTPHLNPSPLYPSHVRLRPDIL